MSEVEMSDKRILDSLKRLVVLARELESRCQTLDQRVANLKSPRPSRQYEDVADGALSIHTTLDTIHQSIIVNLHAMSVDNSSSIAEASSQIESIAGAVDQFENELNSDVTERIGQTQIELTQHTGNAFSEAEHRFEEAHAKISQTVEAVFQHLKDEFDAADHRIHSVLTGLDGAIVTIDNEVERVGADLSRLRENVLHSCRTASVGTNAAIRAVQTLTAAFAKVK